MNKLIIILALGACLLEPATGLAQTATNSITDQVNAVVTKINAKLSAGQTTETDLTNEIRQFDALLARHAGEQSDEVANILFMKATLFLEVIDNPARAQESFKQLSRDFPNSKFKKGADAAITQLEPFVAAQKVRDSLTVGTPFPDFAEKDLNGQPLSPANFRGKIVLLDFWATWCVPCRILLPSVIASYKKHHDQGFEVIGVSLDTKRSELQAFLKQQDGMTWPQYFDEANAKAAETSDDQNISYKNKLGIKYGVNKIPTTFLLDADGKIIAKDLHGAELENTVAAALAKK